MFLAQIARGYMSEVQRKKAKERWAKMSDEEKAAINAKRIATLKKIWAQRSAKERSEIAKKRVETQRELRKRAKKNG